MLRSLLMKAQTGWSVLDNVTTSNIYHNDHPVCAASEASRLFLTGAATPPVPGGEHPVLAIHSHLHRPPLQFYLFVFYLFVTPAAGSLVLRLNSASTDGTQISSRISSFGCNLNSFFSLTQGFVYVLGSVSVIVSSNVSPTRRQRSSRRISSLYGLPNWSSHVLSSKPVDWTTSVSPSHFPTE